MAFGGGEIKDVLIRLTGDSSSLEEANKKGARSFTELNQAVELAKTAMSAVGAAFGTAMAVIDRGQGVTELSTSFNNLQQQAGRLASNELQALRNATQGLASDTDLMRSANEALLSGLSPESFRIAADAADALGDAVGVNTVQALGDLTRALTTGQERLLKQYGLTIDSAKAEADFAKSIGVTADKLNEAGKREAARIAIQEKLIETTARLGEGTNTAGDGIQRAGVALDNLIDKVTQAINENQDLAEAFDSVGNAIASIDPADIANIGSAIASMASVAIKGVSLLVNELDKFAGFIGKIRGNAGLADVFEEQGKIVDEQNKLLAKIRENTSNDGSAAAQYAELEKQLESLKAKEIQLYVVTGELKQGSDGLFSTYDKLVGGFLDANVATKKSSEGFVGNAKSANEAAKAAEELAKKQKQLADAIDQDFNSLNLDILGDSLKNALDGIALGKGSGEFDALLEQFRKATYDGILKGYKDAIAAGTITQEEAEARARLKTDRQIAPLTEARIESNAKVDEDMRKRFQSSVDFFADLLTPMFEGEAANFEDIFLDAAKRIAIGFGSYMLAYAFSGSSSIFQQIGSTQGLGQAIGSLVTGNGGPLSNLGGAGGIFGGLGSIFKPAAGTMTGDANLIASLYSSPPGLGAAPAGLSTSLANTGIIGAVIAAAGLTANSGLNSFKAGQKGGVGAGLKASVDGFDDIAALFASGGLSLFLSGGAGIAGGLFGGNSQKAAEREAREKLLDELFGGNLALNTVNGSFNLNPNSVNTGAIGATGEQIGLVNPLAMIASGGDDKLQSDLANIFAEGIGNADNFNESIANTLSLMDKLGMDAGQAKDELQTLFLDGKISLDEFSAGIADMNVLATENLTGPNSIADAFRILAKNIDTDPRLALKGLELGFKEMAEIGIDTQDEIIAYVTEHFGPEFASVFNALSTAGINSFEDLAAVGPDALAGIFNALNPVKDSLADFFGLIKAGDEGADMSNTEQGLKKVETQAKKVNDELKKGIDLQKQYAQALNNNNGGLNGNTL